MLVPTDEERDVLPRRARVAFVARCARRVLPLVKDTWPDAPTGLSDAAERAVRLAEQAAAAGADVRALLGAHLAAADSYSAPAAARAAVRAARNAALSAARDDVSAQAGAGMAVRASSAAMHAFGAGAADDLIRDDFDRLAGAARAGGWTDDTPVPPEFFGLLWPDARAAGLPPAAGATERLRPLLGRFARSVLIEWEFFGAPRFPPGLVARLRVPAWGLDEHTAFGWRNLGDPREVDAGLALLWSRVLRQRAERLEDQAASAG